MRLPSRAASSTSQAQTSQRVELGESTKTTVSALANHVAEALLPLLATGDAVAVDDALKAVCIERRIELVSKLQIIAAVGDEDVKLAPVGRVGSDCLPRGYITGFRRNRAGCVMRDVCHYTAPIAALNISTLANRVGARIAVRGRGNAEIA
jgi:hypothetical protein